MTTAEKRRREDRARYPIRLWPFLWGSLVFLAILIITIVTTVLKQAASR